MKITFENTTKAATDISDKRSDGKKMNGITSTSKAYDVTSTLASANPYSKKGATASDVMVHAEAQDVTLQRNYMAVMSNSMSDEDFGELVRRGGNPGSDSVDDVVTILDRIKLEIAKSGKQIEGFTDTLDDETIEAMTGSKSLAREIKKQFTTYDVPITSKTITDTVKAYEKAKSLKPVSDTEKQYLVTSGKELTIETLYKAEHIAPDTSTNRSKGSSYYEIEAPGYLAQKPVTAEDGDLNNQVKQFLTDNQYETTEYTINQAKWMVQCNIPVNQEYLDRAEMIDYFELPIQEESIVQSIAIALSEGKECQDACIGNTDSIYEKATNLTWEIMKLTDGSQESIVSRRIMEEIRLKMTSEANLRLLQSGFRIDTKDMESYVDMLRQLEGDISYQESVEVNRSLEVFERIKELPAAVIGSCAYRLSETTPTNILEEGQKLWQSYGKAAIAYEQVGTQVRKDLGDSMKKAFRNVDAILSEMGMEITERNQRAVRILGWNSMVITSESIEQVRTADAKIQNVLTKLSPSDTLELIREGKSPISMSIDELNDYVDSKKTDEEAEIEKYSKYLYKLEQNKSINESERKEYIEVYRFFYQLEKTDLAAVGSVIQSGRDLTIENLKTAMKTVKSTGMDVKVNDEFGFLVNDIRDSLEPEKVAAISDYDKDTLLEYYNKLSQVSSSTELDKAYIRQAATEFKEAFNVSDEVITNLLMNNQRVNADNLRNAQVLMKKRGYTFNKISEINSNQLDYDSDALIDSMTDAQSAQNAYEKLCESAKEQVYDNLLTRDNYIDVRELGMINKQLTLASSYSKQENYEVPVEISGEMTSLNLRIVHNSDESNVLITMKMKDESQVSARLSCEKEIISGYIASNSRDTVSKLQKVADNLGEAVYCVYSKDADKDMDIASIPMKDNDHTATADLYQTAKKLISLIKEIQ